MDSVGNLDVTDLRKSDEGVYSCQASNDEGFAVADARVTVQGGEGKQREGERERERKRDPQRETLKEREKEREIAD